MKGSAAIATLWGLLAVATAAGAEEGGAPLAGTKKQLQQLQADRAAPGAPSAKDGLKGATPSLHFPSQSAPPARHPSEPQRLQDRQNRETGKNWLVEGVAKLEDEKQGADLRPMDAIQQDAGEENTGNESAVIVDTSAPGYLLKLYDQQKKTDDAKSAQVRETQTARPDAFAPFLKDWMAASPVKDQILGDLARRNAGSTAPGGPVAGAGGPAGTRGVVALPDLNREPVATPGKVNPYLVTTDPALSSSQADGFSALLAGPGGAPTGGPVMADPTPAAPGLQPDNAAPAADRKALPPPLADDKKYFPQLNRF